MIWPAEDIWQSCVPLLPTLTVEVLKEVDSTNSELMRRARAGQTDPVLLVAESQTAGRGRLGRQWHAQAGDALIFSLGLMLHPADWSGLSLAVGLSVVENLDPQGALRLGLKWPNDIWVRQQDTNQQMFGTLPKPASNTWCKLAGILIETAVPSMATPAAAARHAALCPAFQSLDWQAVEQYRACKRRQRVRAGKGLRKPPTQRRALLLRTVLQAAQTLAPGLPQTTHSLSAIASEQAARRNRSTRLDERGGGEAASTANEPHVRAVCTRAVGQQPERRALRFTHLRAPNDISRLPPGLAFLATALRLDSKLSARHAVLAFSRHHARVVTRAHPAAAPLHGCAPPRSSQATRPARASVSRRLRARGSPARSPCPTP